MLFFILLFAPTLANVDNILNKIPIFLRNGFDYQPLEDLFRYALPDCRCVQVMKDNTGHGRAIMVALYSSLTVPPILFHSNYSAEGACTSFVLLTRNVTGIHQLIQSLPRYADHRIISITFDPLSTFNPLMLITPPLFIPSQIYFIFALLGIRRSLSELRCTMKEREELMPTHSEWEIGDKVNWRKKSIRSVFRDAEVLFISRTNLTSGYILPQPTRILTPFAITSPNDSWAAHLFGLTDFKGRSITALTFNCSAYSLHELDKHGNPWRSYGVETWILKDLVRLLNLRLRVRIIKDPSYKWYIDELSQDRHGADVAYCRILVSSGSIQKNISLSQSMAPVCIRLLVPRPIPLPPQWYGMFKPFEPEVWIIISTALGLTTFILQRVAMKTRQVSVTFGIKKYEDLGSSFLGLLAILVLTNVPKSKASQGAARHIITWWTQFTFILATCFSSGLISHLTNQHFTHKMATIKDLVKNDYHWAMPQAPIFNDLLNLHDNAWHLRWRFRFQQVSSVEDHIKLIEKGKQALWGYEAFNGFSPAIEYLPENVLAEFEVADTCLMQYFTAFALRKGSPFEKPFNKRLQNFRESGLIEAMFTYANNMHYQYNPSVFQVFRLTKQRLAEPRGLTFNQLSGIFYLWTIGITTAIIVFLLEIFQKINI